MRKKNRDNIYRFFSFWYTSCFSPLSFSSASPCEPHILALLTDDTYCPLRNSPSITPPVLLSCCITELSVIINQVEENLKNAKTAICVIEITLSQTHQLLEQLTLVSTLPPLAGPHYMHFQKPGAKCCISYQSSVSPNQNIVWVSFSSCHLSGQTNSFPFMSESWYSCSSCLQPLSCHVK